MRVWLLVLSDCYDKLVSLLLYRFRTTMPKHVSIFICHIYVNLLVVMHGLNWYILGVLHYLPGDVAKRVDCWYGYASRTQCHNEDHARKRNHVCRPTRGAL